MPWYFGTPSPVARNNFYGFKTDGLKTTADMGTVKMSMISMTGSRCAT